MSLIPHEAARKREFSRTGSGEMLSSPTDANSPGLAINNNVGPSRRTANILVSLSQWALSSHLGRNSVVAK